MYLYCTWRGPCGISALKDHFAQISKKVVVKSTAYIGAVCKYRLLHCRLPCHFVNVGMGYLGCFTNYVLRCKFCQDQSYECIKDTATWDFYALRLRRSNGTAGFVKQLHTGNESDNWKASLGFPKLSIRQRTTVGFYRKRTEKIHR